MWVSGHSFDSIIEKSRHLMVVYDHGINLYMIDQFLSVYGFYSDLFSTTYIIINKEQKSALYKVVGEVA